MQGIPGIIEITEILKMSSVNVTMSYSGIK